MKRVLTFLRPQARRTALQVGIKFGSTLLELFLPWILEHIIDDIAPTGDRRQLLLWGALMLLCAMAVFFSAATANRMATRIAATFTRALRHSLFCKVTVLSSEQVDRFTVPSLISRISTDTYRVNDMVDRMLRLGIRAPILLIGGLLVSAMMEPVLALIFLCTLPLIGGMLLLVSKRSIPLFAKAQQAGEELVRRIQENMTGVRIIKALSRTEEEKDRFAKANEAAVRADRQAEATMAVANPMMSVLLNIAMAAVIVTGAFRVDKGLTEPGKIIAFLNYFVILQNGLLGITRIFTICSRGIASGKRLGEVLEAPERVAPPPPREPAPEGHVVFSNVSFSYNKVKPDVDDLSFTLARGRTLGIIGPTGSGKSTLLQLLLRFYEPDGGQIWLDGRPLSQMAAEDIYSRFGVVFQNDFLFADSILENLDFERPVTETDRALAMETAQTDFLKNIPQGALADLSERGMNLSGGQRQRLLIARALAVRPEILLLDDCSSALDYRTDARLRQALAAAYGDVTKIIVAQRISAIRHADLILVLEAGKVLGRGTHEELLSSCPLYRTLYEMQMGAAA
ncbi:MAG: ABC transporter ATP-binding protein [Clostridia bacterium]|nr:ABC transporter ATP-binding protein [Clostridia bacterium]